MSSCIVDNKRCTRCCEVTLLSKDMYKSVLEDKGVSPDCNFVKENWTPISNETAFRVNPYLRKSANAENAQYFTCKNVTKEGCSIYETRPYVCRGYPRYGRDTTSIAEYPDYNRRCTEFASTIPVVNI